MKLSFAIFVTAIVFVASSRATHEVTKDEEALKLVAERCILCHYLDRTDFKFAPSLKDLYKRKSGQLMNGKPVSDQTVSEWIADGSANMPAFKHSLRPEQIQLIVAFLKEGKAATVPMIRNSR